MYRYLRLTTCVSLIVFAAVVAGGAIALAPGLIQRLSPGAAEVSVSAAPSPTQASAPANAETSMLQQQPGGPQQDAAPPASMDASSASEMIPEPRLPKQAAAVPDQPIERPVVSPPPRLATPEPARTEPPRTEPPRTEPRRAEEPVRSKPVRAKPRLASEKKAQHRQRTAEQRAHKALSAVRRFDEPRESPMNAYAAEGSPRRMVIRPTSIQDMYYYGLRP